MASVSYQVLLTEASTGQGLEAVTAGTNAPAGGAGYVEIRIDQTATAITDGNVPGGTRALKKGEVVQLINYLLQYLLRDTAVIE